MKIKILVTVFLVGYTLVGILPGHAETRAPFFETNTTLGIFDEQVLETSSDTYEFFPDWYKKEKQQEKLEEEVAAEEAEETTELAELNEDDLDKDSIVSRYGDPTKSKPVLAQKEAPAPFGGMMAAMEIGDMDLAYKYARQWSRYIRGIQERGAQVSQLVELAMTREGVRGDNPESDRYANYRELYEKDIKDQQRKELEIAEKLPDEAKQLLAKAHADLNQDYDPENNPKDKAAARARLADKQFDESYERTLLRRSFLEKGAPVDPKGIVDIQIFIRPLDRKTQAMAPTIRKLIKRSREDKQLRISIFTIETTSKDKIEGFQGLMMAKYPILDGNMLAKALQIQQSPTVVLMTGTTVESVFEEGPREFYYLDELINHMQGKK